jgi:hypothetical protein
MTEKPIWLPPMLELANNPQEATLAILYAVFRRDFKNDQLSFRGLPVWWNRRVLPGERYEEGFWHLVSREKRYSVNRHLDLPRAMRLPWCNPCIGNCSDNSITIWNYVEHRSQLRTYIWLTDWDYCVVLERRNHRKGPIAWLITAFHVDGPSKKRNLQRKFENRQS